MKIGAVARAHTDGIDCRIHEADGGIAVGNRLLVDESHVTGPHGRGETGPAPASSTATLVGANVKVLIGFCGDIRNIAERCRALVGGVNHARKLLPGGNWNGIGGDSAAAVNP